jgi:hypothetical protein
MKPRIDVYKEGYRYGLAWFDEDGEGLRFGELDEVENLNEPPVEKDVREHWHAYKAALAVGDWELDRVLLWDSKRAAAEAKRAANAAVKLCASKKPLPEWAAQALGAGWKAPKGWKP